MGVVFVFFFTTINCGCRFVDFKGMRNVCELLLRSFIPSSYIYSMRDKKNMR